MPASSHDSNFRPVRTFRQLRRRSEIEFRTDADFVSREMKRESGGFTGEVNPPLRAVKGAQPDCCRTVCFDSCAWSLTS
jgi:hypothetical protein